jgi:hypothetical protein
MLSINELESSCKVAALDVPKALVTNVTILWNKVPCSLYMNRRFGRTCILQGLIWGVCILLRV